MDIKFAIDHITKLMLELETLKNERDLVVAKNSYLEAMNISLHKQVDELKTRALSYEIEQKLSKSASTKNTVAKLEAENVALTKNTVAKLEAENVALQTKLYDMTKDRDFIESLRSNLQQKYREEKHEARSFSTKHVPQKEQLVYIKHGHTLQYAIESVYLAFLEVYDDPVTADDASRIMLDYMLNISKDYSQERYHTRKSEKEKARDMDLKNIKASLSDMLRDFIDIKEKDYDDMCKIIDRILNAAKTNTKETPIISPYKPHECKIELEVRDHPEQKPHTNSDLEALSKPSERVLEQCEIDYVQSVLGKLKEEDFDALKDEELGCLKYPCHFPREKVNSVLNKLKQKDLDSVSFPPVRKARRRQVYEVLH